MSETNNLPILGDPKIPLTLSHINQYYKYGNSFSLKKCTLAKQVLLQVAVLREIRGVVASRMLTKLCRDKVEISLYIVKGLGAKVNFPLSSLDTNLPVQKAIANRANEPVLCRGIQGRKEYFGEMSHSKYLQSVKLSNSS